MASTFTAEQLKQTVEAERALVERYAQEPDATLPDLAEALATRLSGGTDRGRGSYYQYIADTITDELDAEAMLDVLSHPDPYIVTGMDGVVVNIALAVEELDLMDAGDWEQEARDLARSAADDAKYDAMRDEGLA
jgi:hypothetical protein